MNRALIGNAIRQKRMALGLTQQMLARMADISRQTVSGIEHGRINFTLDMLGRVGDILGLTLQVAEIHPRAIGPLRSSEGSESVQKRTLLSKRLQ